MARKYDLKEMAKKAKFLLKKEGNNIVTHLQLYGQLQAGHDWYFTTFMTSEYAESIQKPLNKNKAKDSKTATDCLREAMLDGNVKAATTYGRIVDPEINRILAPNIEKKKEEDEAPALSKEEMIADITRLLEKNGFN